MENNSKIVDDFEKLKVRIFLNSNILQNLQKYGEYIWDNVETSVTGRDSKNIEELRNIFSINFRASFEFALSRNSIEEVSESKDVSYLRL